MIIKRDQQAAQEAVEQSAAKYTKNWKKVQTGADTVAPSAAEQVLKDQTIRAEEESAIRSRPVSFSQDSDDYTRTSPDPDLDTMSPEMYAQFARLSQEKRAERRKQVLSLRVSPQTMAKAKALGKGYTGILSRLLDLAIDDPEMVKKCL